MCIYKLDIILKRLDDIFSLKFVVFLFSRSIHDVYTHTYIFIYGARARAHVYVL